MKTKLLLITISSIVLLFTSCEKDDMEKGGTGTGGGGMNGYAKKNSAILDQNVDFSKLFRQERFQKLTI